MELGNGHRGADGSRPVANRSPATSAVTNGRDGLSNAFALQRDGGVGPPELRDDGVVEVSKASRSVFVTAARPEDAAIASELLLRCGLEPYSVFDAPVPYDLAAGSFEQIAKTAAAVAAVRGASLPPGVIYELGIAQGLGLPTLILLLIAVDDDLPLLPGDLRGLHQVRWDSTAEPDATLLTRVRELLTVQSAPPAGPQVAQRRSPTAAREYADATERRAAEVLTLVGAHVVAEGPGNRPGRPDLSAWFADLPNWANPVVIEVKARDPSRRSHAHAVQQLRAYLRALQLPIGIVLVPGEHSPEWAFEEGVATVLLGVETLAELGARGTRDILIRARNLVAHGT